MPAEREGGGVVLPRWRLFRDGQRWRVRFSAGGRQHKVTVADARTCTEEEAGEEALSAVARVVHQVERARSRTQNPIRLYQERLETRSAAQIENCERYRERLVEFFGSERSIRSLDRWDVIQWRDWLLKQKVKPSGKNYSVKVNRLLSAKTVKEHIDWLAAVCKYAGLVNPCVGVERPKVSDRERQEKVEFFTPDEMGELFVAVKGRRFENAFVFLAYTGCRSAEMQGIRPADCVESTRIVWVTGKDDRRRPLRLTGPCSPAWEALQREYEERQKDDFIFPQGDSWAYKSMLRLAAKVWGWKDEKAMVPNRHAHPHMLRHTFASMALMYWKPAWSIEVLAKWGGWSNIMTPYKIYAHWIAAEAPSAWSAEDYETGSSPKLDRVEIIDAGA